VHVPILDGGSAGAPEVLVASNCDRLGGADGVVVDRKGDVLVATNRLNKVVRVDKNGDIATIADQGLDFPATLALDAKDNVLVTSFALISATTGGTPNPNLARIAKR
jgi:hypothetical protein